jgi:hypothetical protein
VWWSCSRATDAACNLEGLVVGVPVSERANSNGSDVVFMTKMGEFFSFLHPVLRDWKRNSCDRFGVPKGASEGKLWCVCVCLDVRG